MKKSKVLYLMHAIAEADKYTLRGRGLEIQKKFAALANQAINAALEIGEYFAKKKPQRIGGVVPSYADLPDPAKHKGETFIVDKDMAEQIANGKRVINIEVKK